MSTVPGSETSSTMATSLPGILPWRQGGVNFEGSRMRRRCQPVQFRLNMCGCLMVAGGEKSKVRESLIVATRSSTGARLLLG